MVINKLALLQTESCLKLSYLSPGLFFYRIWKRSFVDITITIRLTANDQHFQWKRFNVKVFNRLDKQDNEDSTTDSYSFLLFCIHWQRVIRPLYMSGKATDLVHLGKLKFNISFLKAIKKQFYNQEPITRAPVQHRTELLSSAR